MNTTDKFVIQQNLQNFRRLLGTVLNVDQRRMILELLAGEQRKAAAMHREIEDPDRSCLPTF